MAFWASNRAWSNIAFDNLDFKQRYADKINENKGTISRDLHVITSQATYRKEVDMLPTAETPALTTKLDAAAAAKSKLQADGRKALSLPAEAEAWADFKSSLLVNLTTVCTDEGSHTALVTEDQKQVLSLKPYQRSLVRAVLDHPNTTCYYPPNGHGVYFGPVCEGSAASIADVGAALAQIREAFLAANLEFKVMTNGEVVNILYGEFVLYFITAAPIAKAEYSMCCLARMCKPPEAANH